MMECKRSFVIRLMLLMSIWVGFVPLLLSQDRAEMIFYNGKILTIATDQGEFPIEEAIAVRNGRILAVGSSNSVLRLAGPETKRIDLEGKAVLPGIIDTHVHPQRGAIVHYSNHMPTQYRRYYYATGLILDWEDKDVVLLQMKRIVKDAAVDLEWIVISGRPSGVAGSGMPNSILVNAPIPALGESRGLLPKLRQLGITIADLDRVSPARPLLVALGSGGMMNSKAMELAKQRLGDREIGFGAVMELLPQAPIEILAQVYRLELEDHMAPLGYTTVSTSISARELAPFGWLDKRGELRVRFGYAPGIGQSLLTFNENLEAIKRMKQEYNSDMLWMTGVSVGTPDGSPSGGNICTSYPKMSGIPEDFLYRGDACNWDRPGNNTRDIIRQLNLLGYRVSNVHTYGDLGLEKAMDLFEEIDKDKPLKGRRFAFDHTQLLNPKVVEKAAELGVMFSIKPHSTAGQRGQYITSTLDREIVQTWLSPVRTLLNAGIKLSFEAEFVGIDPMWGLQFLVTRTKESGEVIGARQRVDRKTALRMMTRWGAEYVLREDQIGSLEAGKFADLLVLDRDPLDPDLPDEMLSTLKVIMTMVAGKVIYKATAFDM